MKAYHYLEIAQSKAADTEKILLREGRRRTPEEMAQMIKDRVGLLRIVVMATDKSFIKSLFASVTSSGIADDLYKAESVDYAVHIELSEKKFINVWMLMLRAIGGRGWEPFQTSGGSSIHFRKEYEA